MVIYIYERHETGARRPFYTAKYHSTKFVDFDGRCGEKPVPTKKARVDSFGAQCGYPREGRLTIYIFLKISLQPLALRFGLLGDMDDNYW
jgi:hypothetical protein